jgi:hypothetical protein
VLARQRADRKQPFLDRLQIGGVEIQPAQRRLDPRLRLAQFVQRPPKGRERLVQCALCAVCRRVQPALCIDQQPLCPFV